MKESKKGIIASLNSEEKTFAELLEETGLARSTLSTSVDELLNENVIEKRENPEDRRIKYYQLTDPSKVEEVRRDTQKDIENLKEDLEKLKVKIWSRRKRLKSLRTK